MCVYGCAGGGERILRLGKQAGGHAAQHIPASPFGQSVNADDILGLFFMIKDAGQIVLGNDTKIGVL